MTEKGNPTPTIAASAWAAAEKSGVTNSNFDFSTAATGSQAGKIFSLLLEGEENALSAAELTQLAGFKNERSLRQAVDRERENSLILASDRGYFRPQAGDKGLAKIRAFVRRMDGRCASNRRVTKRARAVLRELQNKPLDGQTDLWQGGGGDG